MSSNRHFQTDEGPAIPPSVIDTDSDFSDVDENNVKGGNVNKSQLRDHLGNENIAILNGFPHGKEYLGVKGEALDQMSSVIDLLPTENISHGISSLQVVATPSSDENFHGQNPEIGDEQTQNIALNMPRVNNVQDLLIPTSNFNTDTTQQFSESVRIPPEKTRVTANQPFKNHQSSTTHLNPSGTVVSKTCHPSKLIRDNSESTSQPPSKDFNDLQMAPNSRPPSLTDEDSSRQSHIRDCGIIKASVSQYLNGGIEDENSNLTKLSRISEVTSDQDLLSSNNIIEISTSPHKESLSLSDDFMENSSVGIAPPGTIVYHHPNGERAFLPPSNQIQGFGYQFLSRQGSNPPTLTSATPPAVYGRRKITLRIQEDLSESSQKGFFFRKSNKRIFGPLPSIEEAGIPRGTISVSWFEGTSSSELYEHVQKSVMRKMNIDGSVHAIDFRIVDESESPPEEIVLSPFIPDGSSFLLRFRTLGPDAQPRKLERTKSDFSAPDSPSAAPSPIPSTLDLKKLNAQLLSGRLNSLKPPLANQSKKGTFRTKQSSFDGEDFDAEEELDSENEKQLKKVEDSDTTSKASEHHEDDVMGYNPEDQIEIRLRQIADLLIEDRKSRRSNRVQTEKRQVIFVIANYFVLFLSFIAICAELSARFPPWLNSLEKQLENVQKCSTDQESLFECVSRGDYAGLIASFALVLSRSSATKRFFLFGFETPKKLWAVVYESMVTALCWGFSYIMIRRGMNPDTRVGFLRKYWKDAVYGSLAGFNAAFLKHVLKNLIPQETFEHALQDALQERQLKILSWLPSFR